MTGMARLHFGQLNVIDHLDDTVGLLNISNRHHRSAASFIVDHHNVVFNRKLQVAATISCHFMGAAISGCHLGHISCHCSCWDHMKGENVHKLVFVFRFEQQFYCSSRQSGKCLIGWRQHREGAFAMQHVNKAFGFD